MTVHIARPNRLHGLEDIDHPDIHDFRQACEQDAAEHAGWINPNRVSKILRDRFGEIDPNWFSGRWGPACGGRGFMVKTDRREQRQRGAGAAA